MFFKKVFLTALVLLLVCLTGYNVYKYDRLNTEVLSKYGSRGNEVTVIQQKLKWLGYYKGTVDGIYGSGTKAAVIAYQKNMGLTPDGIAGSRTLSMLGITRSVTASVKYGSRGNQVTKVQQKLKAWGYYKGSVDGIFGSQTKNAVIAFQRKNGLTADGVVGPKTLAALGLPTGQATSSSSNRSNDVNLLARIISAEARGEPYKGQVAVGAVILNRVKHPSFPNTLAGVIYQSGAFTAVVDGQFNQPVSSTAYKAAEDAVNGWDPTNGCIYYYNPATATSKWIYSLPVTTIIGKHHFSKGK